MREKVTIKIPKLLYERIKKIIEDTSYGSVTEFIVDVLRDLVTLDVEQHEKTDELGFEKLTKEEIIALKKRLKDLGYFD
ncbi:hypothetical protein JYK00_02580 [Thermosipho ferrireducens]|uniref:CopG family transcriptional regulator n=1 Tax=Thermosipho ferrireducens TaxID=2571116 RepID=A0ABX7S8A0_9BACT|nr:ribbon-helix-helix domain-containing protein [Thermosipho ferrireducens]QTA38429.1 hypothetical protein JYK00_02580 [Thermosipho ferrireducens]